MFSQVKPVPAAGEPLAPGSALAGGAADSAPEAAGSPLDPLEEQAATRSAAAPSRASPRRPRVIVTCIRVTPFLESAAGPTLLLAARTAGSRAVLHRPGEPGRRWSWLVTRLEGGSTIGRRVRSA